MERVIICQKGTSWNELPHEIKDYIYKNSSNVSPIPLTAEFIEKIADNYEAYPAFGGRIEKGGRVILPPGFYRSLRYISIMSC